MQTGETGSSQHRAEVILEKCIPWKIRIERVDDGMLEDRPGSEAEKRNPRLFEVRDLMQLGSVRHEIRLLDEEAKDDEPSCDGEEQESALCGEDEFRSARKTFERKSGVRGQAGAGQRSSL